MGYSQREAPSDTGRSGPGAHAHRHHHAVQFYEDSSFLSRVVGDYFAAGLDAGDSAVIIATREHGLAFAKRLRKLGVNVSAARRAGRLIVLDASDTLSRLVVDDTLDRRAFNTVIGTVVSRARRSSASGTVRAYGEMVDVLWQRGNRDGALRLEELWNGLEHDGAFSLLCAYSLTNFARATDAGEFQRICDQHTQVAPSERYTSHDEAGRLVEIALLQQRAQALEAEIAHRSALEERLRVTLERERVAREEAEHARAEAVAARTLAEDANRVKSEFLAVMSHELRTPLNAIGGYAELIELGIHGPVTQEQRDALDRVQRSKRVLLGLINQVLNYARIETGAVRYEIADVPLDDLLTASASLIAPQLRAKSLLYRYAGCNAALTVRADAEKLHQVLINLLTNAVKFTDPGGFVTVDVVESAALVKIHVRDSGIGIAGDRLDAIFDPFVQVDSHYTRTRDGVGLGLAISRDLTAGMRGTLAVTSAPGAGSTFTITLPRI